jgi:hypothetical protein
MVSSVGTGVGVATLVVFVGGTPTNTGNVIDVSCPVTAEIA